jgi:hypothetical protein
VTDIVISDIKGSLGLTLPVVAAKVELEGAPATAQLFVRGYKGDDLADLLPSWQTFGENSYAQYMKAVSDMQKKIMADNGKNIQPELVATTVLSSTVPPAAVAVGTVYGWFGRG